MDKGFLLSTLISFVSKSTIEVAILIIMDKGFLHICTTTKPLRHFGVAILIIMDKGFLPVVEYNNEVKLFVAILIIMDKGFLLSGFKF